MIIVELNHEELIDEDLAIDGFILGINQLSSDTYLKNDLNKTIELIKKIKKQNRLVFIDLTNLFTEKELKDLKKTIVKLEEANVDYYLYEDLGLMELIPENKRFYYSLTYTTNKYDLELTLQENKYALISPVLTINELKEITNDNTFFIAFGTWRIFYSRRKLLTTYFDYRNKEYEDKHYLIKEENRPDDYYPIVENNGTKIYLNDYFYLNDELSFFKNLILKPFMLDLEKTKKVINLYLNKKNNNVDINQELDNLNIKHHQGLLYEDSILIKKEKQR